MSCVRENSPPLEASAAQVPDIPITITTPETAAPASTDTTKRKRFHPLRNLRRIFRRRTVSSADRAPGQLGAKGGVHPTHIHFATPGCSTTDATLPRTGFGVPITIRGESAGAGSSQHLGSSIQAGGSGGNGVGGPLYFKRETYRLRISDDLDKEMSDYQRSLSEGRLVDSDISRDGLSQSHDSVFSESAGTASSLSITLKVKLDQLDCTRIRWHRNGTLSSSHVSQNELADVLRKRRKDRQGEVSDEDLGLPLSPITPQRKDRGMNKSEGSLSILSMTSSDMDMDDRSASNASGHNLLHLDSSTSGSIGMNRSDNNMDESGDSSKLSHSAAKHKLAVRPKKKGPTRARTRPRETTLLPATPEVNEESLKLSSTNIADYSPTKEADEQAHSLPYGGIMPIVTTPAAGHGLPVGALNPRSVSKEHLAGIGVGSKLSVSGTDLATATGNSTIYVNKHISKSHEFERSSITSTGGDRHLLSVEPINREPRKEDDGFFKRILNYSFKKKNKHGGSGAAEKDAGKEDTGTAHHSVSSPKKDDSNTNTSSVYISATDCSAESGPTEQIMKLSLVVGDPGDGGGAGGELSGYKKVKSGPAARQRVFPKDIYTPEDTNGGSMQQQQQQQHQQRYSSNVEVNRHSVVSSSLAGVADGGGVRKVPLHKSEEYLVSKTRKFSERSVDGGEGDDEGSGDGRRYVSNGERLKSCKLVMAAGHQHGLQGAYQPQQRTSKIPTVATGRTEELSVRNGYPSDSPSKRKTVEKSKSFRTYTDSTSSSNLQAGSGSATSGQHQHLPHLQHHHHLPSLPNLSSSLSVGNFSNNFLETEHKFFSMTEDMGTGKNRRVFKDYISNNPTEDDADGGDIGEGRLLACSTSLQKFEINDNNLLNPREEYVDHQPKSIVLTTNTLTPPEPTSILNKSSQNISQIEENIDKLVSSQFVSIIRSSDEGSSNERLDDIGGHTGVPEFMKIQLNRVEPTGGRPAKTTSTVVLTSSPTPAPPTSPAITSPTAAAGHTLEPLPDAIKMRRFSNENIEITESKPPLPPSVARTSLLLDSGAPKSPPAFRKLAAGNGTATTPTTVAVAGGGSGDVPGSKRNSMNLSQELSDDRKVILQRRTSVTEEKIKYERRISSSSEDIKFEKKKSNSEEVLEKRASSGGGGGSSSSSSTDRHYNSGSSSGDELVVLRKKFGTGDRAGEGRDKDGTPELMKVFARRSLKLRSDDDYKVVPGSGGSEGKPSMCSIDSDKENQSSEEKLDKVGVVTVKPQAVTDLPPVNATSVGQQPSGLLGSGTATIKTPSGEMAGIKNGVSTGDSTPASTGEAILRKNPSSKPFGVPNRFTNVPTNGQPTSRTVAPSFIDVRKTLLPSATQQSAGNNINNNHGGLAADFQSPVNNNNNNNNNNSMSNTSNRHTIAAMNQLNTAGGGGGTGGVLLGNNNLGPTIEAAAAANGELNEFKGILQRRAEWEKRAKEGFK
ncbi:uncharacterized protein LOC126574616 isoform X2 [Anopheles aquasalis]|nr:uncharacterized protein LOC126574616 isoform X2 [Anopheles aquasalis]